MKFVLLLSLGMLVSGMGCDSPRNLPPEKSTVADWHDTTISDSHPVFTLACKLDGMVAGRIETYGDGEWFATYPVLHKPLVVGAESYMGREESSYAGGDAAASALIRAVGDSGACNKLTGKP